MCFINDVYDDSNLYINFIAYLFDPFVKSFKKEAKYGQRKYDTN